MFQLIDLPEHPTGFVYRSTASAWESWIKRCLPDGLHLKVEQRLISNLKHVLVGLEMKAGLIVPHAKQGKLLFEPYFHMLNFEFCVGVFSICEGLGSASWLRKNGRDGSAMNRIKVEDWKPSLVEKFDSDDKLRLRASVDSVQSVRDKLHQDRLGARENIDWHAFSYEGAFTPGAHAMRSLLNTNASDVPKETNLNAD